MSSEASPEWLSRVEELEIRLAHQELALEELTRQLLSQEGRVRDQAETLKRLEAQLRAAGSATDGSSADETPPHY